MITILFACVHNAGRSQMAAAFFNHLADPQKAHALSAGTEPGDQIHPEVITIMNEVGIDLGGVKPKKLTEELAQHAQFLITMGCGESCPVIPGCQREDWPLHDPKGQSLEKVREIRDDIKKNVLAFMKRHQLT